MNGKSFEKASGKTGGKKHIMHLLEEYEDRDFIHERIDAIYAGVAA